MMSSKNTDDSELREFRIGESIVVYRVRHSRRARAKRLEVTASEVIVVAPESTPEEGPESVEAFLESKRRWLFDTVTALKRRDAGKASIPQKWESGAKLMYRGRSLMLDIKEADVERVRIVCRSRFHVETPVGLSAAHRRAALRHAFNAWLRARCVRDARVFCTDYAARLGQEFAGVELGDQQEMWGTCGKDRVLRINWRLIQAPKFAMEYVCAHEVCHLLHRHHDKAFWDALSDVMPEWRDGKARLEAWERSTFEHRRAL